MARLKTVKTIFEGMPKIRRSVTLSEETMDWIYGRIKKKRFKDVSHALDYATYRLTEGEKRKNNQRAETIAKKP